MSAPTGQPPRQSVGWGVFWMCVAMLLLVGMDAIAKHLTQLFPVPQVIWARFVFHLMFMAPLLLRGFPLVARTRNLRLQD